MEVDFIVKKDDTFEKYQVTRHLTTDNRERELGNLFFADKYLKNSKNFLITEDPSETIFYKGITIEKINIIDFLLDVSEYYTIQ